tara:strand:- start:6460 stop:7269 length:810 start_codon:yes stop_codon:yes gene_type:complete
MIEKFIKETRIFEILYQRVVFHDLSTKQQLLDYINSYVQYKGIGAVKLQESYQAFLKQYSKDVKYFVEQGKYPGFDSARPYPVTREDYDIALLLSTILSQHRFEIMHELKQLPVISTAALVIGCGAGVDIELIKDKYEMLDAYDTSLDPFCMHAHPEVSFFEKEFVGVSDTTYDDIFIIELLEHVVDPFELIRNAAQVLKTGGRIIVTLAVDMPQFDHLYNFSDRGHFMQEIKKLGLYADYERSILHDSLRSMLSTSSNVFIVLKELGQ